MSNLTGSTLAGGSWQGPRQTEHSTFDVGTVSRDNERGWTIILTGVGSVFTVTPSKIPVGGRVAEATKSSAPRLSQPCGCSSWRAADRMPSFRENSAGFAFVLTSLASDSLPAALFDCADAREPRPVGEIVGGFGQNTALPVQNSGTVWAADGGCLSPLARIQGTWRYRARSTCWWVV